MKHVCPYKMEMCFYVFVITINFTIKNFSPITSEGLTSYEA